MILCGEKNASDIKKRISDIIESEPLARIDYVEIVSFPDIERIDVINGDILAAVAVYIGKTRLIDNFIIENGKEI